MLKKRGRFINNCLTAFYCLLYSDPLNAYYYKERTNLSRYVGLVEEEGFEPPIFTAVMHEPDHAAPPVF